MKIAWIDGEREPKCSPDPRFPDGKDVDVSFGQVPSCTVELPYPAKRCGVYVVECPVCGMRIGLTTAGRPDDPRAVKMACRMQETKN
jgi:hypothetical protein